MSLLTVGARLLEQFGLKRRPSPLTREQALEARPVRNPSLKWRLNDEDNVEVIIPRRSDRLGRVMGFLFYVPENRPIVLDEVGTRVWHLCDGERTVAEMRQTLCDEYKLSKREVEVSLTEYLRTLGKRGMLGFLLPAEIARELGEQGQRLVGLPGVGSTREDLDEARLQGAEERNGGQWANGSNGSNDSDESDDSDGSGQASQ